MYYYLILLGILHNTMNSPEKLQKQDAEDVSLSPVVGRKRLSRRQNTRKPYKRPTDAHTLNEKKAEKSTFQRSTLKSPNSYIPVPVKEVKEPKDAKKHAAIIHKQPLDVNATSSCSLTNFKQDVLSNCAQVVETSNKVISTGSNMLSISEGTLKAKTTTENKNISGSDSKVVKHFQQKHQREKTKQHNKVDIKHASGNISEDEIYIKDKNQSGNLIRIPKAQLDMLYENKLFDSGSKTTIESCSPSGSPTLLPSSRESVSSPRKPNKRQHFSQTAASSCIQEVIEKESEFEQCSQPNYSETRDEVGSTALATRATTHAQQRSPLEKECHNKVKSSFLNKDLLQFKHTELTSPEPSPKNTVNIKLTPNLEQEVLGWDEGDLDDLSKHDDGGDPTSTGFRGFSVEEVELTRRNFQACKTYQLQRHRRTVLSSSHKKVRQPIAAEQGMSEHFTGSADDKMADAMTNQKQLSVAPKVQNTKTEVSGMDMDKPDESIALGTNNRVQICIGHNRIQINIKSDKKQELCTVSDKIEDSQATSKAVDLPTDCKTDVEKSNSHGFWSYSTDESKGSDKLAKENNKCVPAKRIYNNTGDYSLLSNQSKRIGCENSSSGFKSTSGQQVTLSGDEIFKENATMKVEQFPGVSTDLEKNFPSTSGSRTSKGERVETEMETETTTVTTSPTDLMDVSSDEHEVSLQGKKEMPRLGNIYIKDRKILKPRSLLTRCATEGTATGNSIRKSLFADDFNDRSCENVKESTNLNIVEFGKVNSFKFDFNTGFSSASGRNITLSPEKLRKASVMLDYDGNFLQKSVISSAGEQKQTSNADKLKNMNSILKEEVLKVPHPKLGQFGGFSSASGKKLSVDTETFKMAASMFREDKMCAVQPETENVGCFASASGKTLQKASSFFEGEAIAKIKHQERPNFVGFASASGKKLSVGADKFKLAASIFPEEVFNEKGANYSQFTASADKKVLVDSERHKLTLPILENAITTRHYQNTTTFTGFSSASGKKITLDPETIRKANLKFEDVEVDGVKQHNESFSGFSSASGRKLVVSSNKFKMASSMFKDAKITEEHEKSTDLVTYSSASAKKRFQNEDINVIHPAADNFVGFTSASGRKLSLDAGKLQKASTMFEDTEIYGIKQLKSSNVAGFSSASGKKLSIDPEKMKKLSSIFKDEEISQKDHINATLTVRKRQNSNATNIGSFPGFTNASGSRIYVDNEKLDQAVAKFRDLDTLTHDKQHSSKSQENTHNDKFQDDIKQNGNLNAASPSSTKTARELIEDVVQTYDKALERLNSPKNLLNLEKLEKVEVESPQIVTTPIKPPLAITMSSKKRLGMSRMSNFSAISKEKLDRARMLFDDCDKDMSITPMKSFSKHVNTNTKNFTTPVRNSFQYNSNQNNQHRQGERESSSVLTSTPLVKKAANENMDHFAMDVTPIKNLSKTRILSCKQQENDKGVEEYDGLLLFREKSNSNLRELQNDIELEYLHLKKKLEILEERKKCLEFQRHVIDQCDPEYMRPRLGMLSIHKKGTNRVKLSALTTLTLENYDTDGIDAKILEVTPQNADKLHFNATRNGRAVVYTLDGGKVIPNTRNMIGVSEINNAFQAMHGIEPKLIPKGWVANHYRWIVWKLACYERKFPQEFGGCLAVESIMQQLKYRYDREIDRAERSAIARIVERDDVPNKRIVLCVADVIQISTHKFELLLTDGWYSIRTIIDNLLIRQLHNGKLAMGTKLMIQGAELSDGDACHPLETPDHLKLKINYNNTRRALWHLRLGYYHIPTPFPVLLRSVQPDGGLIACAKVFIIRVYPVRYMEEDRGVKSWRNAKAEEKRANEFDSERNKEFEKVKCEVYDEFEESLRTTTVKKLNKNDLSAMRCPRELYQYIEASNDPESVFEMLTPSQKSLLMEYKQNNVLERQKEISDRIEKRMEEKRLVNRIVTPMMKVLVSDAMEEIAKCMVLNVWKPTEEQKIVLQEEHCLSIYNVLVKRNHDLSTVRRTMFQQHETLTNKRCQRQVLPISMTTDVYYKPMFNEFDTIGVVVEFTIREYDQEVWLADFVGRLLYVKIVDGSKHCSLLDTIKVGQTIACCNLVIHPPQSEFGQCVANQYTTMSLFPQHKHLQQALALFNSHLDDLNKLVSECRARVDKQREHVNLKPNHNNSYQDASFLDRVRGNMIDESPDENATIPSCLTMADVQMSLIDTDKFL